MIRATDATRAIGWSGASPPAPSVFPGTRTPTSYVLPDTLEYKGWEQAGENAARGRAGGHVVGRRLVLVRGADLWGTGGSGSRGRDRIFGQDSPAGGLGGREIPGF